ncbi:MAG: hypothetical protein IJO37_00440 [Ruminiclostridium sp.]|nr:hypothetical protein [Ruminiclostridium sp.]
MMEDTQAQKYFIRSCNVWFPDFETVIENMERRFRKQSFHALLALLCYFRSEITRQQFLSQFFACEVPKKLLPSDKVLYSEIRLLGSAYQNKEVSNAEFDEQLLLAFRRRPTEDIFSPAFDSWDECKRLISKLEKKCKLPLWFDFVGWIGYLKGNVSRQQYVEIVCSESDYLCQLLDFGTDDAKKDLTETYRAETSVVLRLRELCINYKKTILTQEDFDNRFLLLAREFCLDIPE